MSNFLMYVHQEPNDRCPRRFPDDRMATGCENGDRYADEAYARRGIVQGAGS